MKKVMFSLMALAVISLSSCAKEYTCNCAGIKTVAEFKKKADAEKWCEEGTAGICTLE